jgi:DNA-binding Xre family transcriptional regulator
MSNRTVRPLTPNERRRADAALAEFEADREQIIAHGQRLFERLEKLQDAVRLLKAEREAQGLSLADIEARSGITRAALSRLENDPHPNPTLQTLNRLADALNVELTLGLTKPAA